MYTRQNNRIKGQKRRNESLIEITNFTRYDASDGPLEPRLDFCANGRAEARLKANTCINMTTYPRCEMRITPEPVVV